MIFNRTKIEGLYIIDFESKKDERGEFARIFDAEEFKKAGIDFKIVQASQSVTKKKGTLRGMHFQRPPRAESKLIRCVAGRIYDVAVDLRKSSPTFKQWVAVELSAGDGRAFFLPKGLAHGFVTLENDCVVEYFMDKEYSPEQAGGVRWDDPALAIKWPVKTPFLAEKDRNWPLLTFS